ncbi:MAG: uroporphyrinogen decarboxylase family protein [Anaerolineae bacterium]
MAQNIVLPERLCQRLGLDFRWIIPHWVGVRDIILDGEPGYLDMWHTPFRWTERGQYYFMAGHPLGKEDLTISDIMRFDWPDPDQPAMFAGLAEQARHWYESTDYVVGADGIKVGILQIAAQLRGYDKIFLDFALNPDLAHALLDKITAIIQEMYRKYMRAVGKYVQVVVITDDMGTQESLLISPQMFRVFIKPRLQAWIETIKGETDAKVLMHCDGAILPILSDLIEIGVDIINPIQTVVKGFEDTRRLKEQFGDRVVFHGGIDVQQVLPRGTPESIEREVMQRIYDLGRDGGYILAPCHNISFDVPPANVVALFDAAQRYGIYPLTPPNTLTAD